MRVIENYEIHRETVLSITISGRVICHHGIACDQFEVQQKYDIELEL